MAESFIATLNTFENNKFVARGVYLAYGTTTETDRGFQSSCIDHHWLCHIRHYQGSARIAPPTGLHFVARGNGHFKIVVQSGVYTGHVLAQSSANYVGAYSPDVTAPLFRIKKEGAFINELTGPLDNFEIITQEGTPLQSYGGQSQAGADWEYLVGSGGKSITFGMTSFQPR